MEKKFVSYSQHADDYIAWQLLGRKNNGLVIEVGSFDGIHLSNSYSLENLGWSSICIEPNPNIFTFLLRNRPLSTNINAAVVSDPAINSVEFFAEEIGVLSGCVYDEKDIKQRYAKRGLEYKPPIKIDVPASTLDSILKANKIQPKQIDLVSIDVEGFELAVLEGFSIKLYKPSLFIIEANNIAQRDRIMKYLLDLKEYTYLGSNHQNLFFMLKRKINRQALRNFDLKEYTAATQHHPIDQKLVIQSVSPLFNESAAFKRLTKSWFSKLF